eukprot:GHVH01000541.1.p1 GENE.GHVH01000541.1~~GHVH01000541.1.p1  ORF type:complete len:191 (+),score=23.87 GHVH01000541.1:87-659(+)
MTSDEILQSALFQDGQTGEGLRAAVLRYRLESDRANKASSALLQRRFIELSCSFRGPKIDKHPVGHPFGKPYWCEQEQESLFGPTKRFVYSLSHVDNMLHYLGGIVDVGTSGPVVAVGTDIMKIELRNKISLDAYLDLMSQQLTSHEVQFIHSHRETLFNLDNGDDYRLANFSCLWAVPNFFGIYDVFPG